MASAQPEFPFDPSDDEPENAQPNPDDAAASESEPDALNDPAFEPSGEVIIEGVAGIDPQALQELLETRDLVRKMVEIIEKDGRYPVEAFQFLQDGLRHTVERVHGADAYERPTEPDTEETRHVDGKQLSEGLRDLAVKRYGLLAATVLRNWNIRSTRDFGEMVFVLVDGGLLARTEHDRVEDFDDVFPFGDIDAQYRLPLEDVDLTDAAAEITPKGLSA